MEIKHAIVKKINDNIKILLTTEEKPNDKSMFYKRHSEGLNWGDFLMNEWKKSFVEYPVIDEIEFFILAQDAWIINKSNEIGLQAALLSIKELPDSISKGIEIDHKRIDIENICIQTGAPCGYPCNGIENCEKQQHAVVIHPIRANYNSKLG